MRMGMPSNPSNRNEQTWGAWPVGVGKFEVTKKG